MVIAVCHNFPPKNEASIFDLDNLVQLDRSGFRLAFVHPKIVPRRFTQGRQYFFFSNSCFYVFVQKYTTSDSMSIRRIRTLFQLFAIRPPRVYTNQVFGSALPSTHMQNSLWGEERTKSSPPPVISHTNH